MKPSVILLTFNSEDSLPQTLSSLAGLTDDIHLVDSFSTDRTLEIARESGAQITQHAFENYGVQRNWAIANSPVRYGWQLHLDADERLTPELRAEIAALDEQVPEDGFYLPRRMSFLGREMHHGGLFPTWHMRLFRNGRGHCEARLYDQHFYCDGPSRQLKGVMIDDVRMSIAEWTKRHNNWADAEVNELLSGHASGRVQAKADGNPVERKRYLRGLYDRNPLFVRPFLLFFYRYFWKMGFLDGTEGFIYYVLQTFWFRFLVDAKLYERRKNNRV